MIRVKACLFIALLVLAFQGFGQINFNDRAPVDPAARIGKLSNGMTYYIRHNEEPKDRASFYMIQNVGALLETDGQNGLAHFLEHMAFNGTRNFPDKGIINMLEKHGVAFGRNINAYTSYGETVYNLSDVPVTSKGLVDSCLLVLHDWSDYLLLTDKEIDAERGVITEEWRTRRNASFRLQRQYMPVVLNGSKYGKRDIIGDLDVIKSFKYDTLRNFYHDWYRTDLQAIAIVGDLNVDSVEQKVKAIFSEIKPVENPKKREFYAVPDHKEPLYVLATDKEATNYSVSLYIKHSATPRNSKNLNYLREQTIGSLFNMMARDRITELLQKGNPPFASGSISYSGLVTGYNVLAISATAKSDQDDQAFKAIYTEAERIYKYGFTKSELDRAKSNLLTRLESRYKQSDKITNDQYATDFKNYYIDGEPLTSIDFDLEFTKQILPGITTGDVSEKVKQWMTPENRVFVVIGPEKPEAKHLTKEEALKITADVEAGNIEPYVEKEVSTELVPEKLKGSKVVKTRELPEFKAVEWTLANDARVIFRRVAYEKDQVIVVAESNGGSSKVENDQMPSALMMPQFMETFGVGDYDASALRKALAGKKVSLNVSLTDLKEDMAGSSTPKDFETLMQLLYLQFERPRFDKDAFNASLTRYKAFMANVANNPGKVLNDSLLMILNDHNPRIKLVTPEFINELSFDQMEAIYKDRFADAGDFNFYIVGNIGQDTAKVMAEKYIGSLTNLGRTETWTDRNVHGPKGKITREIEIPLQVKKSTVVINFDAKMDYTPEQNLLLSIFRNILTLRCTDEIREKEGGTYGVRVSANSEKYPKEVKSLQLRFDTDPDKANYLKSIIYSEINKIAENGPTPEDLDKAIKNLQKDREQSKNHNLYWLDALTTYYNYGYNPAAPENFENILTKITTSQVQEFAKKLISKADVVDLIFKPKAE